jgi:flagellar biosynthetic protein FliR
MDTTQALIRLKAELGIQTDFSQVLLAYALLLARILPVIIMTPFLGGESVPQELKLGLGVMVGAVLFPAIAAQVRDVPISAVVFVALMLKELFIGLTLTLVVGMVFEAAMSAGTLIDTMSGTNQAQLMVPQMGQNASLFANLNSQMTIVIFLTLGGHHVVIQMLGESLLKIPLNAFPTFRGGLATWAFYETVMRVFGDLMRIALALASPVLLATFLTDLALGLINRVAPQVQVFFVAMQIKPAVTIVIMLTSIHLILARIVGEFGTMFQWVERVLSLLA